MRAWIKHRGALLINAAPSRSCPQARAIHLRISAMTAPSARLAARNHLVGGNPIRPITTIITATISPATPPPTGILLMFTPGCTSSSVCARFTPFALLQMYLFAAARVMGTVVGGLLDFILQSGLRGRIADQFSPVTPCFVQNGGCSECPGHIAQRARRHAGRRKRLSSISKRVE